MWLFRCQYTYWGGVGLCRKRRTRGNRWVHKRLSVIIPCALRALINKSKLPFQLYRLNLMLIPYLHGAPPSPGWTPPERRLVSSHSATSHPSTLPPESSVHDERRTESKSREIKLVNRKIDLEKNNSIWIRNFCRHRWSKFSYRSEGEKRENYVEFWFTLSFNVFFFSEKRTFCLIKCKSAKGNFQFFDNQLMERDFELSGVSFSGVVRELRAIYFRRCC